MIKLTDLKPGDIVRVNDEGVDREGVVLDTSRDEGMACIDTGVQEFWFPMADLTPVPLDELQLTRLGFERTESEEGVKYLKGPFRVLTPEAGNFSRIEIWYREDHRRFNQPLFVHELQNHHLEMTKVPLELSVSH